MAERKEILEKVLHSYERYYDIQREGQLSPFAAKAFFHLHDEQYVFFKSAKISEADANEFVFFAQAPHLDLSAYEALDKAAWEEGLSLVKPEENHRSSDVILVIVADQIDPQVKKVLSKRRHYKSYRFGLRGWSHFRVIALEVSTQSLVANRQGALLKKSLRNIFS